MIKKVVLLGVLALVSIASCRKAEKQISKDVPNLAKTYQLANHNTQIIFSFQTDCSACLSGCNCGSTVIIKGTRFSELAIAANGGTIGVSNFFNGPGAIDIYPGITQDELTKLQSGDYGLLRVSNNDPGKAVYKAGPMPLGLNNFEFAISTQLDPNP